MSDLLLGIDVGTYSSKGVLVTPAGQILKSHVVPHGIDMPQPGHVEQDADNVWWQDVVQIIRELLNGEPYSGADVAGIAVSAIGPCLLALDEHGRPLRPGILYGVDTRAHAEVAELEREYGEAGILERSLMSFTSQAIGPKIRWLQRHEGSVWQQTRTLTTASSYLAFRLTGEHVMDRHTASHYMPLYDPRKHGWNEALADEFLGNVRLPRLGWSDSPLGTVTSRAAAQTGLREGTPVAVGAVDALSEAISVGAVRSGDLMIMYGSTTFFILVQDVPTPDTRVWTVSGAFEGQYNLAAGMSTTGSLTRWFRDEFARDLPEERAYDELFQAAQNIPPGAGGLLVLPYFSGERTPINDTKAKGIIAGLTLSHSREHVFRAVLESVGFGIRHNLETFRALGADIKRVIAVGGGTKSQTWLQIVSDIAGVTQLVPAKTIGASYGDAFLAGLVTGNVTRDALMHWVGEAQEVTPNPTTTEVYDHQYQAYRQLYLQTRSVIHSL
ncbi:FGGY-family carbohydrate kinase [Deinococcus peraridilitoris]|uniref:Pentulose/hexulose kinase n=1 Tax=Deinococcus peraridilitoris (strain DSM 19664 / LMG 22246 / CIP 109416 / KR-200) TaxID=937777 RepID=L0A1M1_DEIPD|nr:FGGY-family carbohydrate kinase [Deinococcus peraridilitoris]AFZ66910.1 pentulose/hexulose kinase [Deinococcus peraridilitoris DSM 19664]